MEWFVGILHFLPQEFLVQCQGHNIQTDLFGIFPTVIVNLGQVQLISCVFINTQDEFLSWPVLLKKHEETGNWEWTERENNTHPPCKLSLTISQGQALFNLRHTTQVSRFPKIHSHEIILHNSMKKCTELTTGKCLTVYYAHTGVFN